MRAAVFLQRPEVRGPGAKILRGVVDERAGRTEAAVGVVEAETLQVQHAQRLHDRPRARGGVEMVGGKLRAGAAGAEGVQGMHRGLLVRRRAPGLERSLNHEHLARIERGEHGQQVFRMRVGGDLEFAGREVEPRGAQDALVEGEGAQVVVTRGVELVGRERGAGAEDADEGAPDELAGARRLLLVADGHLAAGGEELVHVVVDRVVGDAGHGRILSFREREAEQPRAGLGVLVEHLEKVAEAEEQQRAGREAALDLEILLHHRRLALGRHGE